jgi:hypothetical protein
MFSLGSSLPEKMLHNFALGYFFFDLTPRKVMMLLVSGSPPPLDGVTALI